jgi:outer membrane protein insertion porin family
MWLIYLVFDIFLPQMNIPSLNLLSGLINMTSNLFHRTSLAFLLLGTIVATSMPVVAADRAEIIQAIRVEGNERIDPSTVVSYLKLRDGDQFDASLMDESVKSVFKTGLFADVVVQRDGADLVVKVVENPIINQIAFEGNDKVKTEDLEKEIELRERVVYTRTRVQSDVARILELYRRGGRFAATVQPKIITLDQNRVNLVFEIEEGPVTEVTQISFVGNEEVSDSSLRSVLATKETRWWRFLSSSDSYDPDRLDYDKDLLRRYYLKRGYADFRVLSAVAELTPDKKEFYLTITVDEGPRYKVQDVKLTSSLNKLDVETLRPEITLEHDDWYDAEAVENSVDAIVAALNNQQFVFVDVRPRIERNREEKTLNLTFDVSEGKRVFVEKVDINGNERTVDEVVRREMQLVEGDPLNAAKLQRSERNIKNLGFFERVDLETKPGTTPDQTVIDVKVKEQSTGELSVGAGFSTVDGPIGDFGIRERNFLGKGQDVKLSAQLSGRRQDFDFGFTEPYFLDRDLAAGFDLFDTKTDYKKESSFDEKKTGLGLRLGYPLGVDLRQRLYYRFEATDISNVDDNASFFIRRQEGKRSLSMIGQEISYDKRDSRLTPTDGYILKLSTDVAGLGGDTQFGRLKTGGAIYFPLDRDLILSLSAETGLIQGIGEDVRISDRFFLGGDNLRGFSFAGVGPRDISTRDALGGNLYGKGTVEMQLPIGLPEELGFAGHVFSDFGTLRSVDDSGPTIVDDGKLKMSVGVGVSWQSPFGPVRVDFALPVIDETYDKTESFRLGFGTTF